MSAEWFDTHCHLTYGDLASRIDAVVAEAQDAGVSRMITIACSPADVAPVLALARARESVWAGVGIHPHEAGKVDDADLARFAELWRQEPKVVAAGEMGLDYHYDFSPRDTQQTVFRKQLDLAADTELPIVIHCRNAHEDVVRILLEHGYRDRKVVFHCFSGNAAEAAELHTHGWWTSYTGVVTFKKAADIQEACRVTPMELLLLETDAPYLTPEPHRKIRPNAPRYLVHTGEFVAKLKGCTSEELAEVTTRNAMAFFAISPLRP